MATRNVEPKEKDTMYEAVEELYVWKRWKRSKTVKDCMDEIAWELHIIERQHQSMKDIESRWISNESNMMDGTK